MSNVNVDMSEDRDVEEKKKKICRYAVDDAR